MKKIILFFIFITFLIINCSNSLCGVYSPTDDNKKAKEEFIEKIEFSPPVKIIVYYKENTVELKKAKIEYEQALKYQQNYKGNVSIEESTQKLVELHKELIKSCMAHEWVYDYRKDGNVIYIIVHNPLGMEIIIGVLDIKDDMLIGRKGYKIAGAFKKGK